MATLEDKINELQTQLDALKAELANKPAEGVFVPKVGETYWTVHSEGDADYYDWDGGLCNQERLAQGNVFRTKEEAKRKSERNKVIQELRVLAGGWKPDWKDSKQIKWYPLLDFSEGSSVVPVHTFNMRFWPYSHFPTEEALQAAIDKLGDRMKLLLED